VKGRTPLHLAVAYTHPDNVGKLLTAGSDVDAVDLEQMTPLDLLNTSSSDPAVSEITILFEAHEIEFPDDPDAVQTGGPDLGRDGLPALPPGKSSDSGLEDVLPMAVTIVPLVALLVFVMVAVFVLSRKRQRRLQQQAECLTKRMGSSPLPTKKFVAPSPQFDMCSTSRDTPCSFDAHALAPFTSYDMPTAQITGDSLFEDDGSDSSYCSTCCWSSDDEGKGGQEGPNEIHADFPRRCNVGRRCSKTGQVRRMGSKVRASRRPSSIQPCNCPPVAESRPQIPAPHRPGSGVVMTSPFAAAMPPAEVPTHPEEGSDSDSDSSTGEIEACVREMQVKISARNDSEKSP